MSTLLIVDDESWARESVKALINHDEIGITQIIEATNGMEAIEFINSLKPDFIITDMKMPGMDGIRLLDILVKEYPDILAIVLSGYQDFMYTRQAIKSGVIEYLPKPVDETELNDALRKAIFTKRKKQEQQIGYPFLIGEFIELEELISPFRRTLSFTFKELNATQLSNSVNHFIPKVDARLRHDSSFIAYLHQLFLIVLEEMLKEHKVKLEDVGLNWNQLCYQGKRTFEDEITFLQQIGEQVIIAIDTIRKQKSKINLDEIKQYIDDNFTLMNMSLDVIAKKYFVSKEYLTTAFKKKYGCNVTEYIISSRMEMAKQLILTTTLQYKSIAEMVGYEDVSYFYRVFKKYYGTSPGKIRKN